MKGILIYQPTSKSAPLADFIDGLDPRLREKILLRLYFLTQLEKPEMKEPHFKRFSIERYRDLWELRVKSKVLIRIIFCTLPNGDVLLLHGFVKRQKRDTMQALEQSTSPSAFRYAVRYEGHTDLAPYEFFECCNEKSDDEILGAAVQHYDVVEIDDGIKPAFFYKTEHGYELLFSFDAKIAKKNIREEID